LSINKRAFLFSLLFILLSSSFLKAQADFTLLTWNIQDFGKTKDSLEISGIAKIIHTYDIIAIQEVVSGYGGSQAVARLVDQLNRTGNTWDYAISDPTKSPKYKTERYAYIWRRTKVKLLAKPWLENSVQKLVFREPFIARFQVGNRKVLIMNYHARKHDDQPEQEIKHFKSLYNRKYRNERVIIAGDFNLKDKHTVFNPLKAAGFKFAVENQGTTLKRKCDKKGRFRNHPIDNIFYAPSLVCNIGAVLNHVRGCFDMKRARGISDHLPVVAGFIIY